MDLPNTSSHLALLSSVSRSSVASTDEYLELVGEDEGAADMSILIVGEASHD
jgi:hypothetical protein